MDALSLLIGAGLVYAVAQAAGGFGSGGGSSAATGGEGNAGQTLENAITELRRKEEEVARVVGTVRDDDPDYILQAGVTDALLYQQFHLPASKIPDTDLTPADFALAAVFMGFLPEIPTLPKGGAAGCPIGGFEKAIKKVNDQFEGEALAAQTTGVVLNMVAGAFGVDTTGIDKSVGLGRAATEVRKAKFDLSALKGSRVDVTTALSLKTTRKFVWEETYHGSDGLSQAYMRFVYRVKSSGQYKTFYSPEGKNDKGRTLTQDLGSDFEPRTEYWTRCSVYQASRDGFDGLNNRGATKLPPIFVDVGGVRKAVSPLIMTDLPGYGAGGLPLSIADWRKQYVTAAAKRGFLMRAGLFQLETLSNTPSPGTVDHTSKFEDIGEYQLPWNTPILGCMLPLRQRVYLRARLYKTLDYIAARMLAEQVEGAVSYTSADGLPMIGSLFGTANAPEVTIVRAATPVAADSGVKATTTGGVTINRTGAPPPPREPAPSRSPTPTAPIRLDPIAASRVNEDDREAALRLLRKR